MYILAYKKTKKNKNKFKKLKHLEIQIGDSFAYCDENNLGYCDSWREQKAWVKIHKMFDKHFFTDGHTFNQEDFFKDLRDCKKEFTVMYKIALASEKDFRTGYETYGYKDMESIMDNICYINSKWNCAFRIRWILDLLDVLDKGEIK